MEEKSISTEESLAIIQDMIRKTRAHYSDNSFYFIFWGWLTFVASLSHYLLLPHFHAAASLSWLLMPLGAIVTGLYGRKQEKRRMAKTQLEEHIGVLWMALGLALLVLVGGTIILRNNSLMPLFILLYAIGTFITGKFIQFKPLVLGGAACFAISLVSFLFEGREQLLMVALAILLSYLIPGHMLKNHYKTIGNEGA